MRKAACVSLLALVVGACASVGKPIDQTAVATVQKGVTTKDELIAALGPPMSATLMGDGRQSLLWIYTRSQADGKMFIPIVGPLIGGVNTDQQTFQVIVDQNGLVQDMVSNQTSIQTGH